MTTKVYYYYYRDFDDIVRTRTGAARVVRESVLCAYA